jgi:DNA-directed RNA polymerase specialized sigma24 family protein
LIEMTWGRGIAADARRPFEEEWPALARSLELALRARRVPVTHREDIIQETGLRLFSRWGSLDADRPVWPWAIKVALNLWRDELRAEARRQARVIPAAETIVHGVEEEALARLELTRVGRALRKLTFAQRNALLAEVEDVGAEERGAAAMKMRRMRARRSLRSVLDRASAVVPAAWFAARRAARSLGLVDPAAASFPALSVAGAVAIVGVSLGMAIPAAGPIGAGGDLLPLRPPAAVGRAVPIRIHLEYVAVRPGRSFDRPATSDAARHGRPSRAGSGPESGSPVRFGAGGTGIDEDPSLDSDGFGVWASAGAAAGDEEATILVHAEQDNPFCKPTTRSRAGSVSPCVKPSLPRYRGAAEAAGLGAQSGSPR